MKRALVIITVLAMLVAVLAGCGPAATTTKKNVTLKVWGSQEDQAMLQQMIDSFKVQYTDANYTITLGVVGEGDAKTKFLEDPAAAADVFQFANDQISDLVKAGALYEVTRNKEAIIAANLANSIDAATVNGKLYAYPSTADNGYFLYYDKSVFTADDVKSLDKMLEVAAAKSKKVFMDVSNGWYIASFFFGAGCKLGVDDTGKAFCDFNNATGVKVGDAIKAFTANPAFVTGDDSVLKGGIGTTIAAGVSGTWNAADIEGILKTNYAATKLPTFNLGGTQTQMSSFAGFKLVGVNAQTKFAVEAMTLAEWLTNEKNQLIRFNTRKMGPSNKKAAESADVKANIALAALALQNQFAVAQKNVPNNYWSPAEAFGLALENKDYAKTIQAMLDDMVNQVLK